MEHKDPHLHHLVGRVHLNDPGFPLGNASPLFGELDAIRIKLTKEDDQRKMKFLRLAMVPSSSSRRSTYATWLCYSNGGKGRKPTV